MAGPVSLSQWTFIAQNQASEADGAPHQALRIRRFLGMSDVDNNSNEATFAISLFGLVASFALILLSWSLFHWTFSLFVVAFLFPYLIVITLLSWLLSRTFLHWCRIETGRKGIQLFVFLIALLVVAPPFYSHVFALQLARAFVHELAIDVKLEGQKVQLTDQSYRYLKEPTAEMMEQRLRNITSVYSLLEPADKVKDRLRKRLQHRLGWSSSDPTNGSAFRASCRSVIWGRGYEILLEDNGTLHITIEYGYPDYCRL